MPLFDYDDRVRVAGRAEAGLRPGSEAWVVGIFLERPGSPYFAQFQEGAIYTIEFEDGVEADVHESQLEPLVPIGNSA